MAAELFTMPFQCVVVTGLAVPGATLTFYDTGTSTKLPIYTTSALTTEQTNPVVANGAGHIPDTYLDTAETYRLVIKNKAGTVLDDIDPYIPGVTTLGITLTSASGQAVSSRGALAALSPVVNHQIAIFDGSIWEFDSSDLSALVTADTEQGLYVAPASASTGASGAWVRRYDGTLDVRWFGYIADWDGATGTDNRPAIVATLAMAKTLGVGTAPIIAGPIIRFPPGDAYVSAGWNVKVAVHLLGAATGNVGTVPATRLFYPAGAYGIAVNGSTTDGYGAIGAQTFSGEGSIIEGIGLVSGDGGTWGGGAAYDDTAEADGILIQARATIRNCEVRSFQRHGVAILAGSGFGNANQFMFEGTNNFLLNGKDGIHTEGGDTNAGKNAGIINTHFNRCWGIHGLSTIPNEWGHVYAVNNGIGDGSVIDGICCITTGGQRYAVLYGQEAGASTHTPPNATYWVAAPGATDGREWSNGMVFRAGGPAALRDNSSIMFPYKEDGDNPWQHSSPSSALHVSSRTADQTIGGAFLCADADLLSTQKGLKVAPRAWETGYGMEVRVGGDFSSRDCLYVIPDTGKSAFRLYSYPTLNDFFIERGGTTVVRFTWDDTDLQFGRSAAVPGAFTTNNLFLGSNNNARWVTCDGAAPASGYHAVGEIVFNINATAGGKIGWVCTTAGTPGTWKQWGVIDA